LLGDAAGLEDQALAASELNCYFVLHRVLFLFFTWETWFSISVPIAKWRAAEAVTETTPMRCGTNPARMQKTCAERSTLHRFVLFRFAPARFDR
jgi:hypothetical protein